MFFLVKTLVAFQTDRSNKQYLILDLAETDLWSRRVPEEERMSNAATSLGNQHFQLKYQSVGTQAAHHIQLVGSHKNNLIR